MLAQRIQQWKQEWRAEGLAEGLAKGLSNERSTLLRMVGLRFDAETADALAPLLEPVNDPEELTPIGECDPPLHLGRGLTEPRAGAGGRFPLARGAGVAAGSMGCSGRAFHTPWPLFKTVRR